MPVLDAILGPQFSPLARGVGEGGLLSLPFVSYLKVATFGDSTADAKNWTTASYGDQSNANLQLTGATQVLSWATSKWLLTRYYSAAQLEYNGGISGQTTTQMIARSGNTAGPTRKAIEDVLAASPGLIIARCGSINDISAFTTATMQATVDAVFTNHMQIINALVAGGGYVLDEGIGGYDASAGVPPSAPNLAFVRATLIALNQRFAAAIAALGNRKVRFLNPVGVTCDASGAYLPNCTASSDGTHLTNYGQEQLARAEAAIMPGWIGPASATAFTGTNLIATQAAYPSPSTGGTGIVPNSTYFSWVASSGTRQNGFIDVINGVPFASMELLATGANAALTFTASLKPLIIDTALVAAGDVVTLEADFIAEILSGSMGIAGVTERLLLGVDGTNRLIYDRPTTLSPATDPLTSITGRTSSGKVTIPSAIATLTTGFTTFTIQVGTVNVGDVVRLKVGNVRIVKQ